MNSGGTIENGAWTLSPLVPRRGVVFIASEPGFVRNAICANISLLIAGKAASPLLQAFRTGPVLFCTSTTDLNRSLNRWGGSLEGHQIIEAHWFGGTSQLVGLIRSAPANTAAVFVDVEAASPEWQAKAETMDVLALVSETVDFPIVLLGNTIRQSLNPIDQVPRHFRRSQLLLTLRRIEHDDEGGVLLDAYLLLIAKTAIWTEWSGISLSLSGIARSDGLTVPSFVWRELLKGSPHRLAREANAGSFSPAIRAALTQAVSLLVVPMTSTRLWEELLMRGHGDSAIEKALTRGEKRGLLAKNPLRNTDGTFMCWQWRGVVPPWPFPTSGTQSTPPMAPAGGSGGMVGMAGMPTAAGLGAVGAPGGAPPGVSITTPAAREEPRFSDGTSLRHSDADECDQRYATTNSYDRMLDGLELKRAIARDYLRETRNFEPTDEDVELLASSFPPPPNA